MTFFSNAFFLLTICVVVLTRCNPVTVPLKGNYNDKSSELTTTKPVDSVWSNLNHLFTSNGLPVKKIDKEKGLVQVEKSSMNSTYTFENNEGHLEQRDAWVVLKKDFFKEKQWNPKTIYAQWKIRVTETKKGETTITIDPVVQCTYYPNSFTKVESLGQSTGKLEGLVEDYLKQH